MSRWIVALPLLAASVSVSDGRAASAESVARTMAGELPPAQRRSVQAPARLPKSAQVLRYRHHLARKPKSPAPDPLLSVLANARPSFDEDEGILRPHSVNTIRVAAPVSAKNGLEQDQDEDRNLENTEVLADYHNGIKSSPIWPSSPESPAELTTTELMALLSSCCVAAICIYGFVAVNSGRRRSRLEPLRSSWRGPRLPSSNTDSRSDRLARQRLFPHQFGAAIQGR